MAHTNSHLYQLPTSGLRFFTVYGPWGRPDMALFLFTRAILDDKPIQVFNHGKLVRDFTYVDDIVEGVIRVVDRAAEPDPAFDSSRPDPSTSSAPYRVFNIGNSQPTPLADYIDALEQALNKKAVKEFVSMQAGDVLATAADTSELDSWIGFKPSTPVTVGVRRFVEWYRDFYRV
jgi:UDP-glucuronate 4-epimerase